MSFQSSHKTYALTVGAADSYISVPVNMFKNYVVTNTGTNIAYYAFSSDSTAICTSPVPTAGGAATETIGLPILPNQQHNVERNFLNQTPFLHAISPAGTTLLITGGFGG